MLLRTFLKDPQIELLLEKKIPFVTTGSTAYRKVKQVDNDQQSACRELTSILLMRQMKHIALLGGSESFVVNQNRYKGYQQAYQEAGREVEETLVYRNLESCAFMDRAVEEVLEKGANNAHVLNLLSHQDKDTGRLLITLKIDLEDASPVIRSFERFNYTVLYHFMEKGMVDDMLQQRMNELLHYMNM